jgi:hypothetical protein
LVVELQYLVWRVLLVRLGEEAVVDQVSAISEKIE